MPNRPPVICLDCRYIGPKPSGIGNVVEALVAYLPELAPDWQFRLIRNPAVGRSLSTAANVSHVDCAAPSNGPASLLWLSRLVNFAGVDLFHAPANILPRGLAMPCVTTIHDTMWLDRPKLCNAGVWGQVERRFYRSGMRHALARSAAITTVSAATKVDLHACTGLAPPITVVHPGISNAFQPRPVSAEDRQRLGMPAGDFVLTVGQFAPYKNHEGAVRAFAAAFAGKDEAHLVLIQRRGPAVQPLQALAQQLGICDRLHFARPDSESDMALWYSAARALLHPSLCEGFGMPLAEAMACGCPVVTSDISAMPEVVANAALTADPRDTAALAGALSRIWHDRDLAAALARKGRERARLFDRRSFAAGTLDVYRKVLGFA